MSASANASASAGATTREAGLCAFSPISKPATSTSTTAPARQAAGQFSYSTAAHQSSRALKPATSTSTAPARQAADQLVAAMSGSALVVTRDVEWGQVLLGFEQAQHYAVRDQNGEVVALLAEEHGGVGTMVGRQLLRSRRGFKATVLSPDGSVLFKMRRPAYLISSTMYIEDADDERIGEVQQEWRLLKRCYNLFIGTEQYARIESPFLAWEFVLRDGQGNPLALIDRNFSGFGKELFTDAGRYAIHFGDTPDESARFVQRSIDAAHPDARADKSMQAPIVPGTNAVIPFSTGDQLVIKEPLDLDERLVALAAAISIDYDYFSRHSHGSGMLAPFMPMPMPMPVPVPPADIGGGSDVAGGVDAAGGAGAAGGVDGTGGADAGGASYDWGGFRGDDAPPATPDGETFGNDGGDWGGAGFEEFDDFGSVGESADSTSGGLFDVLRDLMSDD